MFTLTDMATQSSRYKSNDNNHRDLKPTTLEISNVQVRAARENRGLERERAMGPTIWIVARRKTDRRRRARSASQERAMTRAKALVGRNAVKSTTRSYAAATNEGGGAGEPDGRGARARTKCRNGALCAAVRGLRFAADGANEFGYAGGGQSIGQRDIGVGFDAAAADEKTRDAQLATQLAQISALEQKVQTPKQALAALPGALPPLPLPITLSSVPPSLASAGPASANAQSAGAGINLPARRAPRPPPERTLPPARALPAPARTPQPPCPARSLRSSPTFRRPISNRSTIILKIARPPRSTTQLRAKI